MTLKGCYCLENAITSYNEHFKYCHVALDRYTLAWYKRNKFKTNAEWSNLDQKDYLDIQENIRTLSSKPDIELFDDEMKSTSAGNNNSGLY